LVEILVTGVRLGGWKVRDFSAGAWVGRDRSASEDRWQGDVQANAGQRVGLATFQLTLTIGRAALGGPRVNRLTIDDAVPLSPHRLKCGFERFSLGMISIHTNGACRFLLPFQPAWGFFYDC
jgi:hypothetical protein